MMVLLPHRNMAYIYKNPREQQLMEAQQELKYWIGQQQLAAQKVPDLQRKVMALRPVVEGARAPKESLPMLCLGFMSMAPKHPHPVPFIRDGLKLFMGVEVTGSNPLGMLHTVLGRLAADRFVEAITNPAPTRYRITKAGMELQR
jgi:hypothetical protein